MALVIGGWLLVRQPETHAPVDRVPFGVRGTLVVAPRILRNAKVVAYTLAAGLLFGAQLSCYGVARSIFSVTYDRAELFTLFFALLALAVGAASLINARLVLRLGTTRLVRVALAGLVASSGALLVASLPSDGVPPLWLFLALCASCFFCVGILFGNLGAMAMDSLGAVAGIGASIIASLSSLVAVLVSDLVGRLHDTSLVPLGHLLRRGGHRHARARGGRVATRRRRRPAVRTDPAPTVMPSRSGPRPTGTRAAADRLLFPDRTPCAPDCR